MKEIKLSPIDKFHLKNLVDSIKYLKNSENTKQWLASNNLIQFFEIEDKILEKLQIKFWTSSKTYLFIKRIKNKTFKTKF